MIRDAVTDDADAIARVSVDTWRSAYHGIVPTQILDTMSYEERAKQWGGILSREVPDRMILVAEDEAHGVVGFCACGPNRNHDSEFASELYAIYVLEAHQGRGIGRALFEKCRTWTLGRGMVSMIVWVLRDNPHRGFYEAMGGEVVSERMVPIGEAELPEVAYGWRTST